MLASRAALLLTRSVVVMATAAWCASSTESPRLEASFGTEDFRASSFIRRPMTPVDSKRTSDGEMPSAAATASALSRQS